MQREEMESRRDELSSETARRYRDRATARTEYHVRLDKDGVFAAAGTASAARRIAHMSISDGRTMSKRRVKGRIDEAIIGPDDSDSVNFLTRGVLAARAVCRLVQHGQPLGTGFLVAPGILLTNNHVIDSAEEAATFVAEFDFELDPTDQPRTPIVRFGLDPDRYFVTSDRKTGLDFTFVGVQPTSLDGKLSLDEFGWIPMDPICDKVLVGEPTLVIQHPRGEMKRVALFEAELIDKLDDYLHIVADTDRGSSGSCVFNRAWQLVALHHAAVVTEEHKRGREIVVNEGIRVSAIMRALDQPQCGENGARVLQVVSDPKVIGDGRPRGELRFPGAAAAARPGHGAQRAPVLESAIAVRSREIFHDRAEAHFGYKSKFLGDHFAVPLPRLPDALVGDAVIDADGEGADELKYTHYSIIFSASRRVPIMSAVNIDGKTSRKLKRADHDFEAADRWYYDPRVAPELQLGPEIYDRTDFDFGHMVQREDPVWGNENIARMANDDTFYMTNCAPQHHDLNTRTWLRLENAILEAARSCKRRISVFTGPVLLPQDPLVLGVQVPTAFWKIVAYVDQGRLRAHGFLQYQTRLVRDVRVRPESLEGLEDVAEYQVPIAEIARVTALDFGVLIEADELRRARRRRLSESVMESLFAPRAAAGSPPALTETPATDAGAEIPAAVAEPSPRRGHDADTLVAGVHDLAASVARLTHLVEEIASAPPRT